MTRKQESIPYTEMAEIIVDSILSENFFERDVLITKVTALIKGFKLNPSIIRPRTVETPERLLKLQLSQMRDNAEKHFWRNELRNIVGDKISEYYVKMNTVIK